MDLNNLINELASGDGNCATPQNSALSLLGGCGHNNSSFLLILILLLCFCGCGNGGHSGGHSGGCGCCDDDCYVCTCKKKKKNKKSKCYEVYNYSCGGNDIYFIVLLLIIICLCKNPCKSGCSNVVNLDSCDK